MDRESVYTLSIGLGSTGGEGEAESRIQTRQQLIDFILEFQVDNQFIYRYYYTASFDLSVLIIFHRDQIRENVLAKKYACDIDVVHLISYNEEIAHRLNTEPGDIIPIVSIPKQSRLTCLISRTVRRCLEEVHPKNRIPIPEEHRTARTSTAPPLKCFTNIHSRSHCRQCFSPCSNTWHRDRSLDVVIKSDRSLHSMPKLCAYPNATSSRRYFRNLTSPNLRSRSDATRGHRAMPNGPIFRSPREVPVHRPASIKASGSSGPSASRRVATPYSRNRRIVISQIESYQDQDAQ